MTLRKAWRRLSNRTPRCLLLLIVAVLYCFMLGPIVITAATSFNEGNTSKFPPEGFSLRWWEKALSPEWFDPLLFTLYLASLVGFLSLLLGLMLSFGLTRYRFPGRDAISVVTFGPIILPNIVIGVALLQFLVYAGMNQYIGLTGLVIGHLVISLPYAVRTISISLQAMPPNVELAAANLGARPSTVLREITLPLIKSGIFAGVIFAFIHSFNDINISLFLSTPSYQVINVKVLGHLDHGFEPVIAAVAVLTFAVPLLLVYVTERFVGIGDFLYGPNKRK